MAEESIKSGDVQVEKIVNDISGKIRSGQLSPDMKLDSETVLMERYQCNVYCIRKALRKLKQCGLLYSIPKFGVFVGNGLKVQKEDSQNIMAMTYLHMKMQSHLASQKECWAKVGEWCRKHLGINPGFHYRGESGPDRYDICENSIGTCIKKEEYEGKVDILKYLPDFFEVNPIKTHPYDIPIYNAAAVLIYNEELLKKLGIPLPSYKNFKEQREYFRMATRKIEEHGLKNPGISQNFFYAMNAETQQQIFDDLLSEKMDSDKFTRKYKKVFEEVCEYYREFHFDFMHAPNTAMVHFSLGTTPFYFGLTYDFSELRQKIKTFSVGGAMMYAMDDRFNCVPVSVTIDKNTNFFLETISVAQALQGDQIQEIFASAGHIPVKDDQYKNLPYHLIIPGEKRALTAVKRCYEEAYAMGQIVSSVLWKNVFSDRQLDELCRKIFTVSRAFLRMRFDDMSGEDQQRWSQIFSKK